MTEPRSALVELTLARLRGFTREPSALFWAFGFPIVLSVALGIAFRNHAPPSRCTSRCKRARARKHWSPSLRATR